MSKKSQNANAMSGCMIYKLTKNKKTCSICEWFSSVLFTLASFEPKLALAVDVTDACVMYDETNIKVSAESSHFVRAKKQT